jgi:hypothetical protein
VQDQPQPDIPLLPTENVPAVPRKPFAIPSSNGEFPATIASSPVKVDIRYFRPDVHANGATDHPGRAEVFVSPSRENLGDLLGRLRATSVPVAPTDGCTPNHAAANLVVPPMRYSDHISPNRASQALFFHSEAPVDDPWSQPHLRLLQQDVVTQGLLSPNDKLLSAVERYKAASAAGTHGVSSPVDPSPKRQTTMSSTGATADSVLASFAPSPTVKRV